jgi:glycosyltransferase involved in cell wall biosynthesis
VEALNSNQERYILMDKKTPKVSVVTAMYKHKPYLKRRADSILNQTMEDWEWIVVDDCSPDGSFEYMRELTQHDPRVTVLQNEHNSHIALTNQRGIDLARGEYLYRTDSDDYCDYRFLERMVGVMDAHPNVVMAHCRGRSLDAQDGLWGGWPKKPDYIVSGWEEFRRNIVRYQIPSPTILFRRAAAQEAGGFTALPLLCCHDWHLSLRVCLLGDIAFVSEPLAAHRKLPTSFSHDKKRQTDAKQMEIEIFGLIDAVLSYVPPERRGEVEELKHAAYLHCATGLFGIAQWAKENQLEKEAAELETMIARYVPLDQIPRQNTLGLKPTLFNMALSVIKPLTYKKLPDLQTS